MMKLARYTEHWDEDDPHANFKAEVANYTVADPLPTIEHLSLMTGIPVESLIRYILVKWTSSGAEAVMEMSPYVLRQMRAHLDKAEEAGTVEARMAGYEALKRMVEWLEAGLNDES